MRALQRFRVAALAATAFVLAAGVAGPASAALQNCSGVSPSPWDISTKVSTATDCTMLLPLTGNNPNDSPAIVNGAQFFGFDDWVFEGKYDETADGDPQDLSDLFDFTGDGQLGSFTFVGPLGSITDIMLVFKSGNNTNLVGYLIPGADGTYATPFVAPPFAGDKDTSHISVYVREGPDEVPGIPEPGALALAGLALAGAALARRRR